MGDAAERSIPATPRRREAARREGVAPSGAVPAGVVFVVAVAFLLPGWIRSVVPAAAGFLRESLRAACAGGGDHQPDVALVLPAAVIGPTAAVVLGAAGAAIGVRFLLDGSAWRLGRVAPRWRRIDPFAGLARMVSVATLRAVLGNAVCLVVIGAVAATGAGPLLGILRDPAPLVEPERAVVALRALLLPVAVAAAATAAAQWGLARLAFERRLRMTPEEFKEEMRSLEADPKIRLTRHMQPRPSPAAARSRSVR